MIRRACIRGFSLIELLVAMSIGLAILAVLGTVFSQTSSGRADLERVSRMVENSRFAADVVGDDIRHAGFYGTFMPASDVVFDEDVSPCDWNTADTTTLGWNLAAKQFPAALQGWDDLAAGNLPCLRDRIAGTDVLAIRRVSSIPVTAGPTTSVYVQGSQCVSDAAPVLVSNDITALTLRTAACGAALAQIRRYFVRVYYVANCNDCGDPNDPADGDGVPTLKRYELVDNVAQIASLAEGVVNLQFEYAEDALPAAPDVPDGVPEQFLTSTPNWTRIVGVRMHALVRSSEPGMSADTTPTSFDLGPGHASVPCTDRYRCRLLTTTFRLNNVAGRREK